MKRLPPLNALRTFEVAGRLRSIRRAAEELSVTAGAVSRQVQSLEVYLGVPLFRREPREVVLTAEGEQYLAVISYHLDAIGDATEMITGSRTVKIVRLRAHTTFSMKWLIPRLGGFHEENNDTEIRLTTSNEIVDFERENIDGAIRLGDGSWQGLEVERLLDNVLVPLCSPEFVAAHPLKSVSDLTGQFLLHSIVRPDDWRYWLEAAKCTTVDPNAGNKYASSILAAQAALKGHGIMMAQRALFQDEIDSGALIIPFDISVDMGNFTYYFVYPKNRLRNAAFRRLRSWLLAQVEAK